MLVRVEAAFNEHPALRMDRDRGVYFAFATETFVRGDVLSLTEFEGFLREAGFSKSQATAIAGRGYKHLMERSESDPASVPSLLQSLQSLRF